MRFAAFTFLAFFIILNCRAQQQKYTDYTVNDGLPSNLVYRSIEDNNGFLWVATDAGIARFDGKHFQVFTTKDGLPDNEVLAVVKETNGRIWVNCFKQRPAYFDEVKNRFINATEDSTLAKVQEGTGIMYFFPLPNGGIMFFNEKGSFVWKDQKLFAYRAQNTRDSFFIQENMDSSRLEFGRPAAGRFSKAFYGKFYLVKGTVYLDSVRMTTYTSTDNLTFGLNEGKFYLFNNSRGKCYIYSNFSTNPIRFRVDSVAAPEPTNNFEFTPDNFYLLGVSGKTYLFNKQTLRLDAVVGGNYLSNSLYKDGKGNMWVSTIDKGLLVYKKNEFGMLRIPDGFARTAFLSVAGKPDGSVLAGNFYGEVMETNRNNVKVNAIPKPALISRVRKILVSQNKIFTFSESGVYVNFNKRAHTYGKTAVLYNDSIIIVGQSFGLMKLNTITEKVNTLRALAKRVTAIGKTPDGRVYFGSTDGLYKYDYAGNKTTPLTQTDPLLRERVTGICSTPDGLVWVATSGSGVVVLKDEKLFCHISEKEGIINNASRTITMGKPGQVWLGTSSGISVISYRLKGNKITYGLQNLSVNDGLTSNTINEMCYQQDTVYAATDNGVSVIPANISVSKFNIPVQLIGVTINQRDTILSKAYKLKYDQHYIQMRFAGIELGGHFKNFKYSLDKNKNWTTLDENTLALDLESGRHVVQIRAVDVNGNISDKILNIKFDIARPYWRSFWFWLLIAIEFQLIVLYLVNRRQKRRREAKLAKEIAGVQIAALEQQAFTSLMNPHFIFNALNSIQHYINVQDRQNANRYLSDFASLIRKNFEAAQQSFTPLEQEIENIKIYLRLEQMRFADRFWYAMQIDENLDAEDWMIPTMMIQPLLENALLHGLMPSSINGEITIGMKEENNNLLITITDNGIGIANSLALKDMNDHKSRGMELIKKRIAALSRFGSHAIAIDMSPAFESEKNPGNKVTLFVPRGLYEAWRQAQQL